MIPRNLDRGFDVTEMKRIAEVICVAAAIFIGKGRPISDGPEPQTIQKQAGVGRKKPASSPSAQGVLFLLAWRTAKSRTKFSCRNPPPPSQ